MYFLYWIALDLEKILQKLTILSFLNKYFLKKFKSSKIIENWIGYIISEYNVTDIIVSTNFPLKNL